ncbi:MAG TPA: tetratricopeptide repeat protein [Candidatus Obscuribacterales bacterium]
MMPSLGGSHTRDGGADQSTSLIVMNGIVVRSFLFSACALLMLLLAVPSLMARETKQAISNAASRNGLRAHSAQHDETISHQPSAVKKSPMAADAQAPGAQSNLPLAASSEDALRRTLEGRGSYAAADGNHIIQPANSSPSNEEAATSGGTSKLLLKPGSPLTISTEAEDLVPTDDPELARKQALAFPDNAEASFIYAVALTRTSRIEEALKEIRRARRLADKEGGPAYFDKMIKAYEEMLEAYPDDNRVRYGLAWAYYMKAYLLAKHSQIKSVSAATGTDLNRSQEATASSGGSQASTPSKLSNPGKNAAGSWMSDWAKAYMPGTTNGAGPLQALNALPLKNGEAPHIKGALEQAAPSAVPQIRSYYQAALKNLDELLARNPDDVWACAYRAHLNAEYTGDLNSSMNVWQSLTQKFPNNPAAYFFLGEGYLKQGNLKECLSNISRAIALRGITN